MRKRWNDIIIVSALISKIVKDIAKEKLERDIWEIQVRISENSISLISTSPLIASELWLFREDIKKASHAKLLKLGYTLSEDIRIIVR